MKYACKTRIDRHDLALYELMHLVKRGCGNARYLISFQIKGGESRVYFQDFWTMLV